MTVFLASIAAFTILALGICISVLNGRPMPVSMCGKPECICNKHGKPCKRSNHSAMQDCKNSDREQANTGQKVVSIVNLESLK